MKPQPVPAGLNQESVWDYPRPPRLEPTSRHLRVQFGGQTIADTVCGRRVLETSHPPVYYFPPGDVRVDLLRAAGGGSYCEWKGHANYHDVVVGGHIAERAVWSYANPTPAFRDITGWFAFYAAAMDACFVDDEQVRPQPGGFYGGWVTSDLAGPFKGVPGSMGW